MAEYLFITPDDPGIPRALSGIAQGLTNQCPSGHSTTALHGISATRSAVDSALPHYATVIYFGHGKPNALEARGQALVDLANEGDIQGVLIAIACHTANGLGSSRFGGSSNRAFLGFDTYLIHPCRNSSRANDAYEQALSGLFFGATLQGIAESLRANLLQAAQDYKTNRSVYRISRGDAIAIFGGLRSNVLAMVCYGNVQKVPDGASAGIAGHSPVCLAALRLVMERDILRLAQFNSSHLERQTISPESLLWLMTNKGVMGEGTAGALADYIQLTDELLRASHKPQEEIRQALGVGAELLCQLHHEYLIERLVSDMDRNLTWHLHPGHYAGEGKFFYWAAIASEAPNFDYSYEILTEAVRRANAKRRPDVIPLPSLRDFVAILEFRLSELRRIWKVERDSGSGSRDEDKNWHWPSEWKIPWNGPIRAHSMWDTEEQVFLVSRAIHRYSRRLTTLQATTLEQVRSAIADG
ncbi:hypothetical protein Sgleb_60110 [Streptomyces glebosus]|uniref:Uncharacterized protein n=1 Tax=Streptomyces glebosus TaxID=249580 RepID=A0A640T449_9ACTN|nr:hypothetical protein [Streptomyces glebosus]GFE17964.1 hypothetical protein Sgleb_60110 [Streptomyces glebosus]GHG46854.1 hypothetical protein GCM10010513_02890 [Streptomyces glebosus]